MAHKKSAGSTANVRDSQSQRLGVKVFGNQAVRTGDIIVRQRGTSFFAGENVFIGKDHTLHAAMPGRVAFRKMKREGYDGRLHVRTRVDVVAEKSAHPRTLASTTKKKAVKTSAPKKKA
jgi:large subunit ribosomal protein L27